MDRLSALTTRPRLSVVIALLACLVLLVIPTAVLIAQSQPVRYVYDELGRLVAVIDTTGAAAIYHYDAVGNLLAITRQTAGVVSILEIAPDSGAVGQTVTLYGTGFSATPSQNTVTFNGVTATVTSSTTTQIVTSVPATATTGTIAVTTPSGSATSSTSFTVIASSAPTITSFSPTTAAIGASVTVSGTNFDTTASRNALRFNATAAVTGSATTTSLGTTVPPSATSGKIRVSTLNGSATSSSDFIIPPAPYAASDVGYTDRMTPGTSKTVTISTAGKIGLVLFDGTAGQRVSLKTSTGMSATVKLLNFNATVFGTANAGVVEAFIDVATLPIAATYTILVDPVGSTTGSVTLTLYDVPADFAGTITAGGSAQTVSTTIAGQNGRLTFTGSAGQRISLKVGVGPAGTS
jgi:YD repeat-containing protein